MDDSKPYHIFISYRRDGGDVMARLLYEVFSYKGYRVFYDNESLSSGRFDKKIYRIIEECQDVLVVLSQGSLERCRNEGDWFRNEITHAINKKKAIIPIFTDKFELPTEEERASYPKEVQELLVYHAYTLKIAYFDSVIGKIERALLSSKDKEVHFLDNERNVEKMKEFLQSRKLMERMPESMKKELISSAVCSIMGRDNGKMVYDMLLPYLEKKFNIRTRFEYQISLMEHFCFHNDKIDDDKYYSIQERLEFSKEYLADPPRQEFWIAFTTDLKELDDKLRKAEFFFSENLLIDKEDIRELEKFPPEYQQEFYKKSMKVRIRVDKNFLEPEELIVDDSGIFARYMLDEKTVSDSALDVTIKFVMPHRKGGSSFFASISEPTYSPSVSFTYPEDIVDVQMIPFLNRNITAKDSSIFEGDCKFHAKDEWVMPMSGAVYIIKEIEE